MSVVLFTSSSCMKCNNRSVVKSGLNVNACSKQISLSVTEELHIIHFNTVFELKGFSVDLQVEFYFILLSLPDKTYLFSRET